MKLGIIQGRLSPPVKNHIQEFPFDTWKDEFKFIDELGLSHIEWLVTESSYRDNPLFKEYLADYKINTICCDHIIHEEIEDITFLKENLTEVCDNAIENNISSITIPLLEKSSMEDDYRRKLFIQNINKFKEEYPSLIFLFEPELDPIKTLDIVNSNEMFYVTYDTGNITSYNNQHEEFIHTLVNKIKNVHIKDRKNGKTVEPFTGDTNFELIFRTLKYCNYKSDFTLQVARESPGNEYKYIQNIKDKFENYYESI